MTVFFFEKHQTPAVTSLVAVGDEVTVGKLEGRSDGVADGEVEYVGW